MNTKAKHTPGPRLIGHAIMARSWVELYEDGTERECSGAVFCGPSLNNSWGIISRRLKEREELLAALEKTVDMYEAAIPGECIGPDEQEIIDAGRAAIAKAKGEA